MALIICPECGKEVSDRAPACIHCGYPLAPDTPKYSLVLIEPVSDDPGQAVPQLCEVFGLTEDEANEKLRSLPAVLSGGLTYENAQNVAKVFDGAARFKILRDEDAGDPGKLREEPSALPPPPSPASAGPKEEASGGMGFGGTVAAVIIGVIAALLILSIF